jgi:hypothetical protein
MYNYPAQVRHMTAVIEELNTMSLPEIWRYFGTLKPPEPDSLTGYYRGIFVGSAGLHALWRPLLRITGLGGWWGKEFDTSGNAVNLTIRRGCCEPRFSMFVITQRSYLDRLPGLAMRYRPENPFPWPYILDEIRRINDRALLGMTLVDVRPFRRLAFPFILEKRETFDGL